MSHSDDRAAPRLRRSLVGVSAAAAEEAFDELEREHVTDVRALRADIAREQTECRRLQGEIDQLRERLETAHNAVNVLRSKLAQERAAKSVLVARLMDQPAIGEEPAAPPAASTHFDEVRLEARSQREAEALRDLVEQLYRTAYAHGALPAGLEVVIPPPGAPESSVSAGSLAPETETQLQQGRESGAAPSPGPVASPNKQRWHGFLLGKLIGRELTLPDGTVIAREGECITSEIIQAADQAGLLFELILPMRLADSIPEL